MMKRLLAALFLVAAPLLAAEPGKMTIDVEPLGDAPDGVVVRTTFRFAIGPDVPPGVPLVIAGSVTEGGAVVKRFRFPLQESQRESLAAIQTLPPGDAEIEARVMVPLEESAPVIVAKAAQKAVIAKTNKTYVAEAAPAEAMVPEGAGAVKIVAPRRDVAVNLFIVDVDVQPPVKRVEYWVEGKKIFTKNEPPYRTELDLGSLPKRVEVRAVGYDEGGRYVDADAFVVDERETPQTTTIIRTVTPDGINHIKVSVQNAGGGETKSVALFAGEKKIFEWAHPPYAIDLPPGALNGTDTLRASVAGSAIAAAAEDAGAVELQVSVVDAAGAPVGDLGRSDFTVADNAAPQTITAFQDAEKLPIAIGLLIDHSVGMEKRMATVKKASTEFLKRVVRVGDRAFVGGFALDPQKVAPFVSEPAALEAQVDSIPKPKGYTSLYDAVATGLYRFRGLPGRKAMIVVTDGGDISTRVTYDELVTYARAARVPLYFIGVGMSGLPGFGGGSMRSLAAETGGNVWFIRNEKALGETYAQLEKELRAQYVIGYRTEPAKGYRTVEVKVDRPGLTARTMRGYIP
ncbi:MAG TPA: VWA domain-containing protein [Thermoanaerobaculia bacterium]